MKELGFSWDVGWTHSNLDYEGYDLDITGISISIGMKYYF